LGGWRDRVLILWQVWIPQVDKDAMASAYCCGALTGLVDVLPVTRFDLVGQSHVSSAMRNEKVGSTRVSWIVRDWITRKRSDENVLSLILPVLTS
jgi:hypothetical protein